MTGKYSKWLTAKTMYNCPVCSGVNTRTMIVLHDSWSEHRESLYCLTCGMTYIARVNDAGVSIAYMLSDHAAAQAKLSAKP